MVLVRAKITATTTLAHSGLETPQVSGDTFTQGPRWLSPHQDHAARV